MRHQLIYAFFIEFMSFIYFDVEVNEIFDNDKSNCN